MWPGTCNSVKEQLCTPRPWSASPHHRYHIPCQLLQCLPPLGIPTLPLLREATTPWLWPTIPPQSGLSHQTILLATLLRTALYTLVYCPHHDRCGTRVSKNPCCHLWQLTFHPPTQSRPRWLPTWLMLNLRSTSYCWGCLKRLSTRYRSGDPQTETDFWRWWPGKVSMTRAQLIDQLISPVHHSPTIQKSRSLPVESSSSSASSDCSSPGPPYSLWTGSYPSEEKPIKRPVDTSLGNDESPPRKKMGRDSSNHACFLPPIRHHQRTALSQGLMNVLRNQVNRQKFGADHLFDLARSDFPNIREDILQMTCIVASTLLMSLPVGSW